MEKHSFTSPQLAEQTHRVINEAKKLGNQVVLDGKHTLNQLQGDVEAQSDKLIRKVHAKPVASLLWAVAAGFILAHLLRK
ncbi:MAG: hypothetical protein WC785_09060 [Tatlockia sp.]|jgi:hypothetical protein